MAQPSNLPSTKPLQAIALLLICCVPTILYQLCYARSFYPITEGWFSQFAALIRHGQIPYVDFHLLLPPLYPLQLAAFQSLFGEDFIALRYFGIVITCGIGIALFDVLRGVFNQWAAALAVAFTLLYYQSGVAFLGYDFTQFLTLYLLIAGALLARYGAASIAQQPPLKLALLSMGVGLFLALAVLIKQSNGGVATAVIGITAIIVVFKTNSFKRAITHGVWMACGFIMPFTCLAAWLASVNALDAFISSVTVDALASKGGIDKAIFGWIRDVFFSGHYWQSIQEPFLQLAGLIFIIAIVSLICAHSVLLISRKAIAFNNVILSQENMAMRIMCCVGALALCALICATAQGVALPELSKQVAAFFLNNAYIWGINIYLYGFGIALVFFMFKATPKTMRIMVVFGIGLGLMFGNGTSAGLSEISMFLGISLIFALLFQLSLPHGLPAFVPLVLALCFASVLIEQKFTSPYSWWAITSADIRHNECAKVEGIFSGLCIPVDEYRNIKRIEADILSNSNADDSIYVFPHMPVFSLLTHRAPFAGAVVSWFDFMSDRQAVEVSHALATDPPAVIIVAELPEIVLSEHERLFRHGKPLGQREILSTISELLQTHRIKRVDIIENINGMPVSVYVKNKARP